MAFAQAGQLQRAVPAFKRAIYLGPPNVHEVHYNLAYTYQNMGQYHDALQEFLRVRGLLFVVFSLAVPPSLALFRGFVRVGADHGIETCVAVCMPLCGALCGALCVLVCFVAGDGTATHIPTGVCEGCMAGEGAWPR